MVYYGALSKGCQRCRQRKIKACAFPNQFIFFGKVPNIAIGGQCDQRRPTCLKCEMRKKPCPGYRSLTELLFRDESQRIKRRFADDVDRHQQPTPPTASTDNHLSAATPVSSHCHSTDLPPPTFSHSICQPIEECAANFFFAYYTTTGPPFCDTYQAWLAQAYSEDHPSNVIRAVIQAVGMAAISNVFNAPAMVFQANERYGQALKGTNFALRNPTQATADSTLMAILLLGLFAVFPSLLFIRARIWKLFWNLTTKDNYL